MTDEEYQYQLEIVQQPVRARMCGLGDKDRRQISPSPFLKLHIFQNGHEVTDIEKLDINELALVVELWTADESEDISLFPSIASSSPCGSVSGSDSFKNQLNQTSSTRNVQMTPEIGKGGSTQQETIQPPHISKPHLHSPTILPVSIESEYQGTGQPLDGDLEGDNNSDLSEQDASMDEGLERLSSNGLSTDGESSSLEIPIRNLIGNVIYNPSKLYDDRNQLGIWFILQDLSIRIEGEFKLKFNLISLEKTSSTMSSSDDSNNSSFDDNSLTSSQESSQIINPYKSSAFSDVVKVYSAKRYPGVIDNSKTHLAKIFAYQGIKIPIRRDPKHNSNQQAEQSKV
ncbi:hypothetical protein WICPIJ_000291 [Wickerhamomyces pijperi]|uniref:Velvet domain-containing protein n=1 Tax=Wickerhamomyces pijperi TaxID=599730 RepID=A0A9P8QE39_WICPI|nr:hypothetical protein WICPIJ_000291 [Wickerhamomyces pijperi]